MSVAVRFRDVLPFPPREGWPGPVSFDLAEGSFVLFTTTPGIAWSLVRLIVGLREPADGVVEVLDVRPGQLNRWETQRFRRRLGVGFDEPGGLVSNLTIRMNLIVPMLYSGLADMATAHREATAILDECDLLRWADTRPADVPPEVRREAVIARAAVRNPELLVLDEPIAGLRDRRAGWLLDLCRRRAKTLVMTTTEREGIQFERPDTVLLLDETGIEVKREASRHEVGIV